MTGPTGSGKTTTLYAALNAIVGPEIKVLTVEDPVEYHLDGVNQIPVDTKVGMTFERGLRAILRHDPDVVMIGEIRDLGDRPCGDPGRPDRPRGLLDAPYQRRRIGPHAPH